VIPVILRDVVWESAPFSALQAVPTGARPVTSWSNRDEAFADVTRAITRAAAELGTDHHEGQETRDTLRAISTRRRSVVSPPPFVSSQ
jgi:hypothetical protein